MTVKGLKNRQFKKLIAIVLAATVIWLVFSAVALAGGWHKIGPGEQGVGNNVFDPDQGLWSDNSGDPKDYNKVPHLDLATSTNKCRTCHAVHNSENGEGSSFKLLRNKTRVTECNACHDAASGLTVKKPYRLGEGGRLIRGEHSLGSTIIPDSDSTKIFNSVSEFGLVCGNCHSVHGGFTVSGANVDPEWATKILRRDPAGNGGDTTVSTAYTAGGGGNIDGGFSVNSTNSNVANNYAASKTAFCADCHNRNSNWDPDSDDNRPNSQSHVQGINVDGLIVVNGQSTQVANFGTFSNTEINNAGRTGWRLEQNTVRGCISCHQATTGGAVDPSLSSSFPHQSNGSKLLIENYTSGETENAPGTGGWVNEEVTSGLAKGIRQSNRGPNKAYRALASMDKVCLDCHRDQRAQGSDTMGVGKTF